MHILDTLYKRNFIVCGFVDFFHLLWFQGSYFTLITIIINELLKTLRDEICKNCNEKFT